MSSPPPRPSRGELIVLVGSLLGYASAGVVILQAFTQPFGLEERWLFGAFVLAGPVLITCLAIWRFNDWIAQSKRTKVGVWACMMLVLTGLMGAAAGVLWQGGPPTGTTVRILAFDKTLVARQATLTQLKGLPELPPAERLASRGALTEDVVVDFVNLASRPRHVLELSAGFFITVSGKQVRVPSTGFVLILLPDAGGNEPITLPANSVRRLRIRFLSPMIQMQAGDPVAGSSPQFPYIVDSMELAYREELGPMRFVGPIASGQSYWPGR